MNVVALVSGGKDSCYSAMKCKQYGHNIIALANLYPSHEETQRDSYMYQTQGWEMLPAIAQCMGLPLERRAISGSSANQDLLYECNNNNDKQDEVEDMFILLRDIKTKYPEVNAVCSGAVLSTYQRSRVENVCDRLGLHSLAFLWQRDQTELLEEMIASDMNAVLVKVCSFGLGTKHLGKSIAELKDTFLTLEEKFGMHVCGEGGEYETLTLDCPLFTKGRIVLDETLPIVLKHIPDSPICVLQISKYHIEPKQQEQLTVCDVLVTKPVAALNAPLSASKRCDVKSTLHSNFIIGPISSNDIKSALDAFALELGQARLHLVCMVHLYLQNMDDFPEVNQHFGKLFTTTRERQPPARVTVELQTRFKISIVALVNSKNCGRPQTLQVRSRSEWAPMCIGPYSQASLLQSEVVLVSGQIPLVPETMQLLLCEDEKEGLQASLELCFQHCTRVAKQLKGEFPSMALVYCNTMRGGSKEHAQAVLKETSMALHQLKLGGLPQDIVLLAVPRLPREALVEVEYVAAVQSHRVVVNLGEKEDGGDCIWSRLFTTDVNTSCVQAITVPVQAVGVMKNQNLGLQDAVQVTLSLREEEEVDSD